MVTMGIDGLASGLDTTSIISNLMKIEAKPQDLLKTQLSAAQAKGTAYRAVNTRFDAIRSAAEALTGTGLAAARTASSTNTAVTATATSAALDGASLSFRVEQTAASKQVLSSSSWTSASDPVTSQPKPAWPIKVLDSSGATVGQIALPADATLSDAVAAINGAGYGVHATIVQLGPTEFRLQVTSDGTGTAGARTLQGADEDASTAESGFELSRAGRNAVISLEGTGRQVSSSTNTFKDVLPGVSWTVSKADPSAFEPTTITVGADAAATTAKVKTLVEAVNGALGLIKGYTTSAAGATVATLQGDQALTQLSSQVLTAVSSAIGGKSAATIGLQLNKDGTIAFDASVFAAKLASDPATVTAILSGTTASTTNGVTTPAVDGIAGKLAAVAKAASDSSTGTLVQLAQGRDSLADSLQDRIDAFDIRLAARQATLTKQFATLETSLNTIKNQSSWLSSQIGQLYNPNKSS
ncbi:flagellar filament capping protein FliD [Klenkia brasiliensis]|uniref:Flagellar hook-associated protein 2 n=1 Tax=Klenkia brasiliensis TaxID=333142 RepID=A0A1G7LIQ9_9ACTN|nr:flagellar filament capping protein FliD [Klenkia brasiliensis]SDF49244.1 flagellar hook-associated protein 2 [Klenkia brasiliensis]